MTPHGIYLNVCSDIGFLLIIQFCQTSQITHRKAGQVHYKSTRILHNTLIIAVCGDAIIGYTKMYSTYHPLSKPLI